MPEPMMTVNSQFHPGPLQPGPQEIRLKTIYSGEIMVFYIHAPITLTGFYSEIRSACSFLDDQPFTVKWVDDEGDPCSISSQRELDEAIRLYGLNRDSEIVLHVFPNVPLQPGLPCQGEDLFPNVPLQPGLPCQGEDRAVYRRGARRWKKIYRVNGHYFQPKRFNKKALCAFCHDRIWGLGRQGFRCTQCRLAIHKRCHKLMKGQCTGQPDIQWATSSDRSRDMNGYEHQRLQSGGSGGSLKGQVNHFFVPDEHDATTTEEAPVVLPSVPELPEEKSKAAGGISLDDFDLLRVIGRGSYAKVVQVEMKTTKQIYAMKIIKKEMVNDEDDIDWVQTEKHVFEVASNHPFLVGLHSCFQTPSRLFFVIEFVQGGDLMFHMQQQRQLPEDHARFFSCEIILALRYLHQRGIIYRDLKLDNVLIDVDGHIKLTDYGMCKEGIGPGVTTGTFCGTPNYIAPEILRGEEYGFSVDWWALGVLMYEMMAGRSPFDMLGVDSNPDANTEDYLFQMILEKHIRIPRSLSVRASSVLKGFLNKEPENRLGCEPTTGFEDIKGHPFFRMINWVDVEAKQVVPPFRPIIRDTRDDLSFFDKQFTDEPFQVEAKQVVPPFRPIIRDTRDDLSFFDKQFTDEPFQVEAKQVVPPFRPIIRDTRDDLSFFDKQFTDEPFQVEAKQVVPPFRPIIRDTRDDLSFFDKQFTDEPFQVEAKQVVPPFRPIIRDTRDDLSFFDKQFTDEPIEFTPDDPNTIEGIDQSEFDGFEYVNPLLMSREDTV